MRQIILLALAFSLCLSVYGQTENKNIFSRFYENQIKLNSEKKEPQFFVEVNPQFFAFGGFGGGIGVEYSRFQSGFIYLNTKLTPTFRDAIFNNAADLEIPVNWAAEIFATVYLRRDRKGFYLGMIYSYDGYTVIDVPSQNKEKFTKSYLVTRTGFRWFPLKEYFYLDGGYGLSVNLNGESTRTLGSSTYSPKTTLGIPFFAIGGRFSLSKKTN